MSVITKEKLGHVIANLPRQIFIDLTLLKEEVECDCPFPPHQRVLPPRKRQLKILGALELDSDDRVLQIGVGFGLNTAVLASLVDEVVAIDCHESRVDFVEQRLERLGRRKVLFRRYCVNGGLQVKGRFDAILVETATGEVPPELLERLRLGGRLVTSRPVESNRCQLIRYRNDGPENIHRQLLETNEQVPSLAEVLACLSDTSLQRSKEIVDKGGLGTEVSLVEALKEATNDEVRAIYQALSERKGIPLGHTEEILSRMEPEVLDILPRRFMKHHKIIPIGPDGDTFLFATPEPYVDLASVRAAVDCEKVQLVLVRPGDYYRIWRAIQMDQLSVEYSQPDLVEEPDESPDRFIGPEKVVDSDQKERHKTIFNGIVVDAIGERASDIHLERYDQRVRVRFRVDGECVDMKRYQITPAEMRGIINVIKINSNLDIADRRLPQGGRMAYRIRGRKFDLRVQTQPTHHGEYVVIRLLPQDNQMLTIRDLGFPEAQARQYERLLLSPSGLLLVVGPTGSGKSTTLYAGLQPLARDTTRKVITVEDPVEYSIDNIQQTQVQPLIGFNFADAMRSFVRQDPDVILVGEIRDGETALEAIRASQTGHLVLSTLHSNDSVDAVQRLFDLQMHANSIASELVGVIAQRLARRICTACREKVTPDPEVAAEVFPDGVPDGFEAYRGRGCSQCEQRGTYGRVAVVEFLKVNALIRRAISSRLQVDDLRDRCLQSGLVPMRESALKLVRKGVIPFEEMRRILPEERMAEECKPSAKR